MSQFATSRALASLSLSALMIGCSGGQSSSTSGASATAATSSLQGTWTQCSVDSSSNSTGSTMAVTASSITASSTTYGSANCTGAPEVVVSDISTYVLGGASSTVTGATNITVTVPQTVQFTPMTASIVTALNSNATCGFTNWALNVAQNVPSTNSCIGATPLGNQIFEVSGTTLYLGNTGATALDMTSPWQLQQ